MKGKVITNKVSDPFFHLFKTLGKADSFFVPQWVRASVRRKFSRRYRGQLHQQKTDHGFSIQCKIGDPLDNLIFFDREFEPELGILLKQLAPSLHTVIDVGCNIGYVSCLMASLTSNRASILSLDANPAMSDRCRANMELNGFKSDVLCLAAGSCSEKRTFNVPEHRPSYASFGELAYNCRKIEVQVARLDALVCERQLGEIDLIKIDVEGFEPEVFRGFGALGGAVKNIIFEYSAANLKQCGFKPEDIWNFPWWPQYRLYVLEQKTGRPIEFRPGEEFPPETEIVWAQAVRSSAGTS